MRGDAAKPYSARSSPAWLRDKPITTPEVNKSLLPLQGNVPVASLSFATRASSETPALRHLVGLVEAAHD